MRTLAKAFAPVPPLTWIPGAGLAPPSPYQTLIWPLFTMTTLPGIVSFLSTERADKLWALMSMSGVRRGPYLAAHFTAGVLSFVPLGALYVGAGALALLTIRFVGWSPASEPGRYDEQLALPGDAARLLPPRTKLREWRRAQVGDEVEVRGDDRIIDAAASAIGVPSASSAAIRASVART